MGCECYTISKSDAGWIIRVWGTAVLDCKRKRSAVAATLRAKQLMVIDGATPDGPNSVNDKAAGSSCKQVQSAR
jgi:hypothetical protein